MRLREKERLAELLALEVLDTGPEPLFDDVVLLASRIAGVPTALVSLMDADRQWFKARLGLEVSTTTRDVAFCDVVVRTEQELEVADARTDERFAENPLVTGPPYIVFYAGFPLTLSSGQVMGTLCVIGYEPRVLDEQQRHGLRVLARQMSHQLELRRHQAEQAAELQERRRVEAELAASRREYRLLAEHSSDIISRHAPDGRVTYVSPAVRTVLGYDPEAEIAENAHNHVHPDDQLRLLETLGSIGGGDSATVTVRSRHADGSWRHLEITLSPLLDEQQQLVEIYSAARDVTERIRATERLERALELSRAVLDSISVGVVACDADGRLTVFNPATRDFHGIPVDSALSPEHWAGHYALYHPDGRTLLALEEVPLHRALVEGTVEDTEMVIAPNGLPPRLVNCNGQALHAADGSVAGAVVAMTDITATREAERRLRAAHEALRRSTVSLARSEAQFRDIFENGPLAMCRLDGDGVLMQVNPALRRLLSLPTDAILGRRLTTFATSADRERLALAVAGAGTGTGTALVEIRLRLPHGRDVWCELALSAGADEYADAGVLVQLADIDARKSREIDLERRAAHDELTQLPNRAALHQHLNALLAGDDEVPLIALYLDLNGFKAINDTMGHRVGDEVLVEVSRRLRSVVRSHDLVARLGGDEFVILHSVEPGSAPSVGTLVDRVRSVLSRPIDTSAGPQQVAMSIGVATAASGDGASDLLARADTAMYEDKRQGRAAAG